MLLDPDESLVQMGMLSRRQVILPTHQLTIIVNYRLFSTLGFPYPSHPSEGLFPYFFFVNPNTERATYNSYVANAIYSAALGAQLVSDSPLGGDVLAVDCSAEIKVTFKIGGQPYPYPCSRCDPGTDSFQRVYLSRWDCACDVSAELCVLG